MTDSESARAAQWEDLYDRLSDMLPRFGKTSPSSDAELWLVDDDWGGHHHKIEVINTQCWSGDLQQAIRRILAEFHPNWGVYIDFEDCSYVVVYADGVETAPRWP
jgi:hypothetical protein